MNKKLKEKIAESLSAVLPITVIVVALCITVTPMPLAPLTLFLAGACLLIIGMGFFTLGADMAMMPIGEHVGSRMAKFKKLGIIALLCFFIGAIITIAEPDLKVLAHQMPSVPDMVLILSVACGVGAFLALSFLRTLFGWNLSTMLMVGYAVVFLLTLFVPQEFLAVAFDSGGVTTGPMTVPFIMALGLGLASIGKSEKAGTNSFGMIALCSLGPILAVLLLGLMYDATAGSYTPFVIPEVNSTRDLPVLLFFLVFQIIFLRLRKKQLLKILMGMVYTFIGLTLFLTGVNVGFMPVGNFIGAELASLPYNWILVPLGMLIGYYIVKAEPAVLVLNKQVEDITSGAISQRMMMGGLSIGMATSVGLSMLRVLTGLPLLAILLPGYVLALGLSFVVPPIFTAIAFDSGGVASGPMTATFLLPLAMGACESLGGNMLTDAFGIVAMVAMTPLIMIQLIGLVYRVKTGGFRSRKAAPPPKTGETEEEIISLDEEDVQL